MSHPDPRLTPPLPATPADLAAVLHRAADLHRAGQRAEAADLYRRLLAAAPSQPDALHLLGVAVRADDPDTGGRLLARALSTAPHLAPAWINLSRLHKEAGRTDRAVQAARRAAALDPALFAAYSALAEALAYGGQGHAATAAQTRAQILDPGNPDHARILGGLRRLAGWEAEVARVLPGAAAPVSATLTRIAGYFDTTIRAHGATAAGVSYSDPELHAAGLQRLARILDVCPDGNARIHDIGCGYGRLFEVVRTHPALRLGHYWGCDLSARMVETARRRISDPRARFAVASLPEQVADVTVVAGTYNLRFDRDDGQWWEYIRGNLRHLARMTRRGLAFSLLSRHAAERQDALYYADPGTVLSFVLTDLTPNAVLLHDFADNEFVVLAHGPFRDG